MPILYKKTYMKKHTEVTREELDIMAKHRHLTSYTNPDIAELYNMVRTFVNSKISTCYSCQGNLRDAKNMLNSFYNQYKDEIEARLNAPAVEETKTDLQVATEQVESYKKETKKKKKD